VVPTGDIAVENIGGQARSVTGPAPRVPRPASRRRA